MDNLERMRMNMCFVLKRYLHLIITESPSLSKEHFSMIVYAVWWLAMSADMSFHTLVYHLGHRSRSIKQRIC